jgi:hypothetical protein
MSRQTRRLGALFLATALVTVIGLGTTGIASGKKAKPLKVSCDQLYAEIDKTGAQFQAQYNAMGFTIGVPNEFGDVLDGARSGGACHKQGKRIRQGNGYMIDIHSASDRPFPGETNPQIREYDWFWDETVTRTKTRLLRVAVSNFRCEKYTYDGSPGDPHNVQTIAC